jgi:predicted ferric reductase
MARLKALAEEDEKKEKQIDLLYTTNEIDEVLIDRLKKSALAAKIGLHIILPARDGRLDFNRICELVPKWQLADIWFCGPAAFGAALKKDAIANGVSANDFHQELFDMR